MASVGACTAALVVVSTAASVAVVSTQAAALAEAVLTPLDLMTAGFVARRFAGVDSGTDFGLA